MIDYMQMNPFKLKGLNLKVPLKLLEHLSLRAEENGSTLQTEVIKRLSRSLERDFEMIELDNDLGVKAFNMFTGKGRKKWKK